MVAVHRRVRGEMSGLDLLTYEHGSFYAFHETRIYFDVLREWHEHRAIASAEREWMAALPKPSFH
jgi:hypothetical protein